MTYKNILKHKGTYIDFTRTHKMDIKEGLAQKFYDHYGDQGADTLNFARQTGPDLGNMVDYVLKENKKLKEQVEDAHQKGFDAGREEYQVDQEFLDEKDEEIDKLKEQVETTALERDGAMDDLDKVVIEKNELSNKIDVLILSRNQAQVEINELEEKVMEIQEQYDHLRSVHSKVVQDLNARTEKVIEMTLQHQ